jgi:hypothetical protein
MLTRLMVTLAVLSVSLAVVIVRPWRFCRAPQFCPQCRTALPRWTLWGWDEEADCRRCGCRVRQ